MVKLLPRDERAPGAPGYQQSFRTTEVRDARPPPPSTGRETEAQQIKVMCPKPQSLSVPEPGLELGCLAWLRTAAPQCSSRPAPPALEDVFSRWTAAGAL